MKLFFYKIILTIPHTHTHKNNMPTLTTQPTTSNFSAPKAFRPVTHKDVRLSNLQQKMMDNGWQLYIDDVTGESYFSHKTYDDKRFHAYTVSTPNNSYTFPIVVQDEDVKGLGCRFQVSHGTGNCEIVSNEWKSYWDTRKGRRREKYYVYLKARQDKKAAIEEENKKHQARNNKGM